MLIGATVPKMKIIGCLLANDMPCICQEARTEPLSHTHAGTDSCPPEIETLFHGDEKKPKFLGLSLTSDLAI
jgi:hypothetical protein